MNRGLRHGVGAADNAVSRPDLRTFSTSMRHHRPAVALNLVTPRTVLTDERGIGS